MQAPQEIQSIQLELPESNQPPLSTAMLPLQSSSSSNLFTGSASQALAKRLREDANSAVTQSTQKKRRVSLPGTTTTTTTSQLVTSQKDDMNRSKSCNELNQALSPVQLLKSFAALKKKRSLSNPATFVKPSEKDLSSYDTCVVNAIRSSNIETLKSMHKEGRSLNACNQFGESLLHMACRRGNPDVVRFLVEEANVNVRVRDDYGRTVLHDATWTSRPNFDVMDILLKAIQPEMLLTEDVRGHTPFDYARKEHWAAWVTFLKERADKLTSPCDGDAIQITA